MNATATLLAPLLLVIGQAESEEGQLAVMCVVAPIYDVSVPALEPGALTALTAKRGNVVAEGQVLGSIDNSDAMIRKLVAENELKAAETQAASDADVQAAEATIGVAKAEWEGSARIKSRVEDAVSEFQVRRDHLTYIRSTFQADTAKVQHQINQITRGMRTAQLQAVENEIRRRQIVAPISGVIADRFHNIGEWAQAGQPIYRLVHMDRLRVEGMLKASVFTHADIETHPNIVIRVATPDGDDIRIDAKIDYVSRQVDHSGEFLISAEFDNPRGEQGSWKVRPGIDATVELSKELSMRYSQRTRRPRSARSRSSLDIERIRAAQENK